MSVMPAMSQALELRVPSIESQLCRVAGWAPGFCQAIPGALGPKT